MGWTMRHHRIEYDVVRGDGTRVSRLMADGEQVDEQTADYWESSTLTDGDMTFEVRWGPRNTITSVARSEEQVGGKPIRTPLLPPPGSKAAAREAYQREHPTRFVIRRMARAGGEIVIGVLGFGALVSAFFGALLPRIDLSWIPSPALPDLSRPGWLRYLDVAHWLRELGLSWPDLPEWVHTVSGYSKYVVPLVIAAFIALDQIEKRRKIDAERDAARRDDEPD